VGSEGTGWKAVAVFPESPGLKSAAFGLTVPTLDELRAAFLGR